MPQLLDIPNALSGGFTNWGQTAGENIVRGRMLAHQLQQEQRQQQQQNALAATLSGKDQTAIAQALAPLSPTAAIAFQQGNAEQAQKDTELKRGRFFDAVAGGIASTAMLPPDQQEAAWQAQHQRIAAQFPEFDDGKGADDWATAKNGALQLAAADKRYADVFGRVGLLPPEPAKPEVLPDKARLFEYAKTQGFGGSFQDFLKLEGQSSSGGTPYYNFLPGANGYLVGNARTGQITPGMVNGQQAVPGALAPELQGTLAASKARGTEVGKAEGAVDKRTIAAPNLLFLLNQAEQILPASTGSGFGQAADKAAALIGKSTKGAEAGDQLKIIAGNLTLAQPRMEGPQSDADRLLYQQMAADLGNTALPVARRQAALGQLRRLTQKYADDGTGTAPDAPSNPASQSGFRYLGKE